MYRFDRSEVVPGRAILFILSNVEVPVSTCPKRRLGGISAQFSMRNLAPSLRIATLFVFAAVLFSASSVSAQSNTSIAGVVIDSLTGLPIADAVVQIDGSTISTHTLSSGSFALRSVPLGTVRLRVRRIGYRDFGPVTLDIIEGFTRHITITLAQSLVPMPDQTVEHRKHIRPEDAARQRYSREEIIRDGHRTVSEALAAIPGVTVFGTAESPGGTRVSVGGERPHRVAVLFDGLPLSGGPDGAVDLDAIPLSAVSEITVTPGSQSSTSGDAAIGGVVDIRSDAERSRGGEATLRAGQYDRYDGALSGGRHVQGIAANAALEHSQRGDRFEYPVGDSSASREGTGLKEWRTFLSLTSPSYESLRVSGFYYNSDVGLPGALQQTTPNANNESSQLRLQGTWNSSSRSFEEIGAGLWFEQSNEHFVSPERLTANTELNERFVGGRAFMSRALAGISTRVEAELRSRRLEGIDHMPYRESFGVVSRSEYSLRARADRQVTCGSHVLWSSLAATVDGDNVSSPFWAPRVDVGWSVPIGLHARAGWGRSFRRPLLTSLFWKADAYAVGNPDLKPERAEEWEIGLGVRRGAISLDTRYFERAIENIIIWQRSTVSGQYQPLNVDRTHVEGREDHARISLFNGDLSLDYAHVYNGAYDQSDEVNYQGQTLVLTPRHTHDASLTIHRSRWQLRTSGRWVSLRHIRRQNNPAKALAPYRVIGGRVQYVLRRSSPTLSVALDVDNLTNEYYELLERYPAPGRAWSVSTSVTF